MPLYDFACSACGERFEERTAADASPPPCPVCAATATERLLSGFATSRSPAMRGAAAQRSNDRRAAMVDQRHVRSERQREQRTRES